MNEPNAPHENPFLLESQDDPPRDHRRSLEDPPRKRRGFLLALIAGVLVVAGLVIVAWNLRRGRSEARDALADARAQIQTLSDALELHRASSDELGGKLESCKTTVEESDVRVTSLEANLAAAKTQVVDLKKQKVEAKERLAEFNAVTRSFQSMINTGKLKVIFREGQMIVKLPSKVLFASGSAEVSKDGAAALSEVATILRTMGKRKFTVAGHTDNIGISTAEFKSNWELSAARAVAVVQILIERGVPANQLAAAGFGPYSAVASNATARGRQENRRMEIILEPYLRPPPKAVTQKSANK